MIRRRSIVLLVCLAALGPDAARAQRAPIFLEPGHWTYDAIRRLAAAGLTPPAADPANAPVTLARAQAVFRHAIAEADRSGRPEWARLAEGFAERLLARTDTGWIGGASLRGGWLRARGEALAGDGYFVDEDWQGATPLPARAGPIAAIDAFGWLHPRIGWQLDAGRVGDRWAIPAGAVTASAGPLEMWAGRRRLQYGVGRAGSIVIGAGFDDVAELTDRTIAAIDGAGIHVHEPFRFPWMLRALGETRIELVAGRLARNGIVNAPWVGFGRITITPFNPRLELGVNRGAVFGGDGNPITLRRMSGLLIGLHGGDHGEFENQVFSVLVRYRPPLGTLPLALHYERGMDDTAGAFRDVPATIAGFELAALPGLHHAGIGIDHTRFAQSCCGNPIWYRSVFFRGSWADQGRLFAHPLGGHGSEWRAHGQLDLPHHGWMLRASVSLRDRGDENLFAPERAGRSTAAAATLLVWPAAAARLRFHGSFESGAGWSTHRIGAALLYSFGLNR